ncbi:MAG: hypothetical protein EON56_01895 [Alphaproteobacteria bacterium]|nr:MAG: hypothetical protein EON56_01895 [Alphaproteobacteria bacterium]
MPGAVAIPSQSAHCLDHVPATWIENVSPSSHTDIAFEPRPQGLWIVVTDGGRLEHELSVDKTVPPPASQDADLPEAGMGLLLIRSLMDRVELQGGHNADTSLKMWKALPRKESVRS